MSDERSQRLIRELAADLRPVALFPQLRSLVASVVLLWASVAATVLLVLGPRADLAHVLASDRAYAAVVLGLTLAGIGGVLAGLAACVPGRESTRLAALTAAVSALTVAGVACLSSPSAASPTDLSSDLACVSYAALLSLPLVAWISSRALRGFIQEPSRVAVIALFGAVAMTALVVHLFCPAAASSHFLTAHLGAAPLVALIAGVPLSVILQRLRG